MAMVAMIVIREWHGMYGDLFSIYDMVEMGSTRHLSLQANSNVYYGTIYCVMDTV